MIVQTLIVGMVQTNCYIVVCEETRRAAIIDPGWSAKEILQAVASLKIEVDAILLTHAHFDHIGAAADLVNALHMPVAIHPFDLPLLHNDGGARLWGVPMRPVPEPTRPLAHGQIIEVGRLCLEARFAPGHTPGHVVFYLEKEKAVFAGDVLFLGGIGRTDLPGGDSGKLIASIRAQLLTLPDDVTVYSGHGPATTIGRERRTNPFL